MHTSSSNFKWPRYNILQVSRDIGGMRRDEEHDFPASGSLLAEDHNSLLTQKDGKWKQRPNRYLLFNLVMMNVQLLLPDS